MNKDINHMPDFKVLFESAPGLYLVLSPAMEIVAVSDAYLKATLTKREEITGKKLFDVFPDNPDDPTATGVGNLHASLKRVLQHKEPDAMAVQKYDIPRPTGGFEERFWSPLNSPVLNRDGSVQYIIHQVEDVTDFIRLKQKGIEQDEKAEKMETEIYLRAQQLQAANEKLRESERMKDQFLANMSHEIRTPMNAIIGFAALMDKTKMDEKQREFNDAIRESGQHLLGVINDILDFSKIEAGKIEFEQLPFSIRGLVDSIYRLLWNRAKIKDIDFKVSCDSKIHEVVVGDRSRMTQILVNLLGNAIKFTEKGFVKLDVNLKERKEDYRFINFIIEDSGIGISKDNLDKIFDRFIQASSDTNRKYGGTGLGLSIVKNLVELQGGTIHVESEPGKGSVFTITLPFKVVNYEQLSQYKASELTEETNELEGIKILIAEDNKMNQRLAIEVLSGFGIITDVAENGKIAIEKLNANTYDLILMDMQMAEMDGYDATIYIRKELKSNIPIIAMTAHAMPGERDKCFALGMNDYISKPFKTAELYTKIKNQLQVSPPTDYEKNDAESIGNMDYLKKIQGSGMFLLEMINIFITEVPDLIAEMETAFEKKDYTTLRVTAHKIQNSSLVMGTSELTGTLNTIQDNCSSANHAALQELINKAKTLSAQVIKTLEKEKRNILSK